ncbi:MAPEG family protein [Stenotrophomonas maltophilia]|jgi:MAPEG family|nr:MAPEG family protein [Stenotrophomonas maltophilia]MBF9138761.1 MAPEG family protein [Stenotrophomonas sp. 232]MRE88224.1 MAPEG family protein [Stenotrophomonas sp. M37]MRF19526.1 MAPEG family protein [Stenotrophomonas sp. MY18]MRF49759.1 MAPEG family protein [Stenotrophomonas sp. MY15]MRG16214.1 MAPEG family protein [Stenotrophomonas sp. MY17]
MHAGSKPNIPDADPLVDLAHQRRGLFKVAGLGVVACVVGLFAGYLLLPRYFDFPEALTDRFVFWARLQVFLLIWVAMGVGAVSRGRRRSAQDIRGSAYGPPSPRVAIRIAFLQNSLEQAVLASGAYLALITLLAGPALSLLVSAAVLFGIGRVTFFLGYQRGAPGRGFGFVLTVLPTLLGYAWALFLITRQLFA